MWWLDLLLTFVAAFLTILVARPIAIKIGLVDKPNYRKRHQGAIPLIGGISLFMGNLCFYLLQWDQTKLPQLYLFSVFILLAIGILGGCIYALSRYEEGLFNVVTWDVLAVTGGSILLFGVLITALCAGISVNKFLRMKAGELYKI